MNIAIIFAGGSGVRMGAGVPKQFLEINGKPILIHTLQLFQYHDQIDAIYISVLKDYIPYVEDLANEYHLTKVKHVLAGGATSQDSIYNALKMAEFVHMYLMMLLQTILQPLRNMEMRSHQQPAMKRL